MGKIVVSQFVTVDGVVEGPGGGEQFDRQGWAFQFDRGDEGNQFKLDEVMAASSLLLGRRTYEGFAAAWPSRTDDAGFADKFNSMPKYVVSSTLPEPLEWNNSSLVKGDLADGVRALKENESGDILVNGSVQLVAALAANGLVDEYRLMVFPVLLGAGKKLFGEADASTALRLTDSKPVGPDGIVILTYVPKD
jgi:dihydrofolate reductase